MSVCKHCHSYQVFKDRCWFFWEGKRACSQFREHAAAEPTFISIERLQESLREKPGSSTA